MRIVEDSGRRLLVNSCTDPTEGVIARSLDLLLTTPLTIVGETSILVRHNLLRRENSLADIEAVCAHPQALAQCQDWLSTHLPHAERRGVSSNAEGARLASLDGHLAAVAGDRAGAEFGLHVVAPAIQDDAHNRTRFAVVTHPQRQPAPKASGHDCTSLVVSVANRPGAVHDMLVPLKTHGVSMTRFESRPARSGPASAPKRPVHRPSPAPKPRSWCAQAREP